MSESALRASPGGLPAPCRRRSRRLTPVGAGGFTLIELLIVISIMALLAAIMLPSFKQARRYTKKTACQANLRSIGTAMQAYLDESGDVYPYACVFPSLEAEVAAAAGREPYLPLYKALDAQIAHQSKVFLCPADRNTMMIDELGGAQAYYASEGTSYEWRDQFNGRKVGRDMFSDPGLLALRPSEAPMVYDYEPFHGGTDVIGSHNTLYADLHVAADSWSEGRLPGEGDDDDP